ncbi:MAG: sugar phosphate isomerase/epimerase [Actinomycetota bacterium]|nr:sugar phosphate isomerase/epimerase [Actinomycetota bacterium]
MGERALRLGLNVPNGWWPVAPLAKSFEAAGLSWLQVHTPPRGVLCDGVRAAGHAARLRAALDVSGLALVLHAPDDLSAGTPEHDRALDGLIAYAAATRARFVVYHGVNFRVVDGGHGVVRTAARAEREVDSLGARLSKIADAGFTLAIENLAPVWPGPARLCHSPERVRELVSQLTSAHVGMTFDVGHAHITADALGGTLTSSLEAVRDDVVLFHLHDNLGARRVDNGRAGLDPLRLDLHLPPGAGSVPWGVVAPLLHDHPAPMLLEVHPPHRPEPLSLATVTSELLRPRRTALAAPGAPVGGRSGRTRQPAPISP